MSDKKIRKDFQIYDRSGELRQKVDQAARQIDSNRSHWIRAAIREKLARDGMS